MELGYEYSETGISFEEMVDNLNIDLSIDAFKINYIIWFYSNFYNEIAEEQIINHKNHPTLRIQEGTLFKFKNCHNEKSFIKGDTINKYVDYLELERTREASVKADKNSKKAFWFSIISIIVAIISVIIQSLSGTIPKPPYDVIITNQRDSTQKSVCNKTIQLHFRNDSLNASKNDTARHLKKINNKKDTITQRK